MLRKTLSNRLLVGMAIIAIMVFIRSLVVYKYVPVVYDIWNLALLYLNLLPIDGAVAEFYGFWSGEKQMAFLVGFLPSIVALLVASIKFGWFLGSMTYLFVGLGMGIMGFGGAKYREDRRWGWLVAGLFVWLLIILSVFFGSG